LYLKEISSYMTGNIASLFSLQLPNVENVDRELYVVHLTACDICWHFILTV
jgi:hypothetical protein